MNFNIEIRDSRDNKWYTVVEVGFRFWKNHPSDGINYIKVLNGREEEMETTYIAEVKCNSW